MRILFVGAVEFSRHCLAEILKNDGNVVGVLTLAKEHAKFHADYADLSDVANWQGISIYRIRNINDPASIELIRSLRPDLIFVFGWSQLIGEAILAIPPLGCVGSHPALLPRNRGRHPIVWALALGLEESGLTFFYLDASADSGDILWQKSFPITLDDDAGSLYNKIELLASEAIAEFLPKLVQGTAPRIPQAHSQATYWRRRGEKDGEINWSASTMEVYNLIRALTHPYVGAHTYLAGRKLTIWRAILPRDARPPTGSAIVSGTVFKNGDNGLDVRTGDGYLTVSSYELPRGGELAIGTRLGAPA